MCSKLVRITIANILMYLPTCQKTVQHLKVSCCMSPAVCMYLYKPLFCIKNCLAKFSTDTFLPCFSIDIVWSMFKMTVWFLTNDLSYSDFILRHTDGWPAVGLILWFFVLLLLLESDSTWAAFEKSVAFIINPEYMVHYYKINLAKC